MTGIQNYTQLNVLFNAHYYLHFINENTKIQQEVITCLT
jgi:hypothetical protein